MRRPTLFAVALALALAGCGPIDQEAMVLTVEPGWTAEIVASEKDGFASPDGLLWAGGTLYVADEGGSAVRAWRRNRRRSRRRQSGPRSPGPGPGLRRNMLFQPTIRVGGRGAHDRFGATSALVAQAADESTEGWGSRPRRMVSATRPAIACLGLGRRSLSF